MKINRGSKIKRESILGLPVIHGSTGRVLGVVKDVYAGRQSSQLEGFLVSNKGWRNRTMDIAFDKATIGIDAVIAEGDLSELSSPQKMPDAGAHNLLGKRVVREDGVDLGVISDIILDPLTGRIEGLELSESVVGDLISGRKMLPYKPQEFDDGDILVISMEQAESITSGSRGIKNILFSILG